MAFKGDLRKLPLADVFQSIHQNGMTGALAVRDHRGERLVAFQGGFVTGCASLPTDEDDLAHELVRRRLVDSKDVSRPSRFFRRKSSLKSTLKRKKVLDSGEFDSFTRQVVLERVYQVFLLEDGQFEFLEEYDLSRFDENEHAAGLRISPNEILMEAMRRVDEWKRIRRSIPSFREVYVATRDPAPDDPPLVAEILASTKGGDRDLEAVLGSVAAARFAACEQLLGMVETGDLRVATAPEYLDLGKRAEAAGDLEAAASFYARGLHYERGNRDLNERRLTVLERLGKKQEAADERKLYAGTLLEQGDSEAAEEQYAKAARLATADPLPLERLLALQIEAKDYLRARDTAARLVALYLRLGLGESAKEVLPRVLLLKPKDAWLRERMAETHVELHEHATAARIYRELAEESVEAGEVAKGARFARRACELQPDDRKLKGYLDELESGALAQRKRRRRVHRMIAAVVLLGAAAVGWGSYEFMALQNLRQASRTCMVQLDRGHQGVLAGLEQLEHISTDYRRTLAARWSAELTLGLAKLYAREGHRAAEDFVLPTPAAEPLPPKQAQEALRAALDPPQEPSLEVAVGKAEEALAAGDREAARVVLDDVRQRVERARKVLAGTGEMARRADVVRWMIRRLRALQPRIVFAWGRVWFHHPEAAELLAAEAQKAIEAYESPERVASGAQERN